MPDAIHRGAAGGRGKVEDVSGRVTQYTKDEFGLVFSRGTGPDRERRHLALRAARQPRAGAVAGRAEQSGAAAAATRSPLDAPKRDTAADLRRRARRGRPGGPARSLDGVRREPATGDGGRARPGRGTRARSRSPTTIPVAGVPAGRRGRVSGWGSGSIGRRASSAPPRPGERCACYGYFLPSQSPELESFLERCRADRVRAGERWSPGCRAWASASSSTQVLLQANGGAVGRPARGARHRPPGRRHRRLGCVRPLHRPGAPGVRGQDLPSVPRDRGPGALGARAGLGGAHQGARDPDSFSNASSARDSTRSRARHPSHDPELRARLTDIAMRLGLLRTGGSDWHGDPRAGGDARRPRLAGSADRVARAARGRAGLPRAGGSVTGLVPVGSVARRSFQSERLGRAGVRPRRAAGRRVARAPRLLPGERYPGLKPPAVRRAR